MSLSSACLLNGNSIKGTTYFSEFWAAYHPVFQKRSAQKNHQSLEYGEKIDLPENAVARLVHESGQRKVLKPQTALDPLILILGRIYGSREISVASGTGYNPGLC